MRRVADATELLDGPLDDPVALAHNLRDLGRANRFLGGTDLSWRAFQFLVRDRTGPVTLLDVGTGGADIPAELVARSSRTGSRLTVTGVDNRAEVLAAALTARPALADLDGLHLAMGDGRALSEPDGSWDIVHTSLVLHHVAADEVVGFLHQMGRVASVGIIVNDLSRSRLAWVGAWLLAHLVTRNRLTRHDAPLSVRRAYTIAEMHEFLARAGLRPVLTIKGFFGHRYAIAAAPSATPAAAHS